MQALIYGLWKLVKRKLPHLQVYHQIILVQKLGKKLLAAPTASGMQVLGYATLLRVPVQSKLMDIKEKAGHSYGDSLLMNITSMNITSRLFMGSHAQLPLVLLPTCIQRSFL